MAEKKLTKTQELVMRTIGLIGTIFFGGLLVYGALADRISILAPISLVIIIALLYSRPIRLKLKEMERRTPAFFYEHVYLILLLAFLIGAVVAFFRLKSDG